MDPSWAIETVTTSPFVNHTGFAIPSCVPPGLYESNKNQLIYLSTCLEKKDKIRRRTFR